MPKFQQRDAITGPDLCPPWLCAYQSNAQLFMYLMGISLDILLEKMDEAMLAKCPGLSDPTAIPLQAADRLMVQGPGESNTQFTARLSGAFDAWARAGSRKSILGQLQAYLTDLQPGVAIELPECLIVGGNTDVSTWDTIYLSMTQGATPAHALVDPANWDWDGLDKNKRAWLILFMHLVDTGQTGSTATIASTGGSGVTGVTTGFATLTGLSGMVATNVQQYITITGADESTNNGTFQVTSVLSATSIIIANTLAVSPDANDGAISWSVAGYPYIGPAPVWGSPDALWGDTNTWGVNCSPLIIQSIRQILQRWKSAGTYYPNIIISFGGADATAGSDFSPNSGIGAGNPDGTWGDIGKLVNNAWVPSKDGVNEFTAYCDGSAISVECQEKNVT